MTKRSRKVIAMIMSVLLIASAAEEFQPVYAETESITEQVTVDADGLIQIQASEAYGEITKLTGEEAEASELVTREAAEEVVEETAKETVTEEITTEEVVEESTKETEQEELTEEASAEEIWTQEGNTLEEEGDPLIDSEKKNYPATVQEMLLFGDMRASGTEREFADYCSAIIASKTNGGGSISESDLIKPTDTLYLKYTYDVSALLEDSAADKLKTGDVFYFYLPEVLKAAIPAGGVDYIVDGVTVAKITVENATSVKDGKTVYKAAMEILAIDTTNGRWTGIGNLAISADLDEAAIFKNLGNWDDSDGILELDMGKGTPLKAGIDAFVTPDLISAKSGSLDLVAKCANWEIIVLPETTENRTGVFFTDAKLMDTIEAGQTYRAGSAEYSTDNKASWTTIPGSEIIVSGNVMTIALSELLGTAGGADPQKKIAADGKEIFIRYQTEVDCGFGEAHKYPLKAGTKIELNNEVKGTYKYKKKIKDTVRSEGADSAGGTASQTLDEASFVEKLSDKTAVSSTNPYIKWTILLNSGGMDMEDQVVIADTLPVKIGGSGRVAVKDNKLKVFIDGGTVPTEVDLTSYYTTNGFRINLNTALGKPVINQKIKIEYETEVEYEKANLENGITYTNNVELGIGPGPYYSVTKSAVATIAAGAMIAKSASSYNTKTHEFTWKIEVKNYVNNSVITDFKVYDRLPANHDYVSGTYTYAEEGGASGNGTCAGTAQADGILLLDAGGITNKTDYTFTVITKWNDAQIDKWATNLKDADTNTSANIGILIPGTVISGLKDRYEVSAKQKYNSRMIAKSYEGYNYSNNTVSWKITVNQNQLELQNGVVEDTVPAGLEIVEASLQKLVTGGILADYAVSADKRSASLYMTPRDGNGTITEKKEFIIQTKITDESFLKNNGTYKAQNKVALKGKVKDSSSGFMAIPAQNNDADASADIKQETLYKQGSRGSGNANYITWTVDINKNQAELNGMILDDTLPEGLALDDSTIKLVGLKISESGTKTEDSSLSVPPYVLSVSKNIFTIEIKEKFQNAYRLTYTTYILDEITQTSVSNSIAVRGGNAGTQSAVSGAVNASYNTIGGDTSFYKKKITIQSVLKDNPAVPVPGAVYQITREGSTITYTGTADANGQVVFTKLMRGNYTVKELSAPGGYTYEREVGTIDVTSHNEGTILAYHKKTTAPKPSPEEDTADHTATKPPIIIPPVQHVELPQKPEVNDYITSLMQAPDSEEKQQQVKALRDNLKILLEQEPGYFDDASEEMKQAIYTLLETGELVPLANWGARLPKTGGFWGSDILYLLGILLILTGAALLYQRQRKKEKE